MTTLCCHAEPWTDEDQARFSISCYLLLSKELQDYSPPGHLPRNRSRNNGISARQQFRASRFFPIPLWNARTPNLLRCHASHRNPLCCDGLFLERYSGDPSWNKSDFWRKRKRTAGNKID